MAEDSLRTDAENNPSLRVHYAAVHERNRWRRIARHDTLENATTGPRGAEYLLLNKGTAADRHARHGDAHAAFVWLEGRDQAFAYRLRPGTAEIERALVPVHHLGGFKPQNGPSLDLIGQWFASSAASGGRQAFDQLMVEEVSLARSVHGGPYRYGDQPTWKVVLDAVRSFGRPVSSAEVGDRIVLEMPDFARANLGNDLSVLSVNCFSRGNHAVNRIPRRTDTGHTYDQLIRIGRGRGVLFGAYDPRIHGVWELADVGDEKLRPRFVCNGDDAELHRARGAAAAIGMFNPTEDARQRIMSAIVQREGQPAFREALLGAYDNSCAITGCRVVALLEAAHIVPYRGAHTNVVGNGLLLRADLHKLFDVHLLAIDPQTLRVRLSEMLIASEYKCLDGARLRSPKDSSDAPIKDALSYHWERCGWLNEGRDGATRQ